MAWGGSRRGAGRPRNPIKRIGRSINNQALSQHIQFNTF